MTTIATAYWLAGARLSFQSGSRAVRSLVALLPFLPFPTTNTMSQTSPEAASRSNYQPIFEGALEAYQRKTGKDLTKNPLLRTLETCHSPDAVLTILRGQIVGPGQSHTSTDKLTKWLIPTVNVINAFSESIGGALALVSLKNAEVISPRSTL